MFDHPVVTTLIAVAAGVVLLKVGFMMLGSFARPRPEPPPEGELRRVNLRYRCPQCGAEMRMTMAPGAEPDPPRHCMDEMELVTPVE